MSMTGYGKTVVSYKGKKITVEVKSLNSKALDLTTRVSSLYREKEIEIRRKIQTRLFRGKIDCQVRAENDLLSETVPICPEAAGYYYNQVLSVAKERGIELSLDWNTLLHLPGVMAKSDEEELESEEWEAVDDAVSRAITALIEFRRQEGVALERMFREKIDNIERLMKEIEPYEKQRVEKVRRRLEESLSGLHGVDYDQNRLEQELIYYIEKLDISEEKQRLKNHLAYFRETLDEPDGGQGKKLGFIAQEMGREINTTGSKANQAEMQNIVVKMKDELEQIKEQVLNVL